MPSGSTRGWKPVRVRKTRQISNLELRFDSIETGLQGLQRLVVLDRFWGSDLNPTAFGVDIIPNRTIFPAFLRRSV
jgi:hypothetical protein